MPTGSSSSPAAPTEDPTFADLGLAPQVLAALADLGYEEPSPVQAATIPVLLEGRDVVGLAQTGTGKTAAFALPVLSRLDLDQRTPQALVLAPTRELAVQVAEAFERYAAHLEGVHVLPVYGGQGYGIQLSALRRGVHIVVGTPGRVMDHLRRGTLDLSELRYLVLDEADEMLAMGFAEDVDTILADTPADKQVALFSATMPPAIRRISGRHLDDPVEISIKGKTATASAVTQRWLEVGYPRKVEALSRILEVETFESAIVFVRTKTATDMVAERLRARGFSAASLNGDVPQAQRERIVGQLREGKLDVLVATDVAARGLDVERITHVINFDIPTDTESYVHRIGRTGRAGRSGDAISFVTPREKHLLRAIERANGQQLTRMQLPSVDDVNATRVTKLNESITAALASDELDLFRDVVAGYEQEHDVPATEIAAALAVMLHDGSPLLLEPDPEPAARTARRDDAPARRADRPERGDRHGQSDRRSWDDDRQPFASRQDSSRPASRPARDGRSADATPLTTYRIAVGRRHKVEPRQIVGAIANEGGLRRGDFGRIDIRGDHSFVELPVELSPQTLTGLSRTRISGKLIDLAPADLSDTSSRTPAFAKREPKAYADKGFKASGPKGDRKFTKDRTEKPRHKKRDRRD